MYSKSQNGNTKGNTGADSVIGMRVVLRHQLFIISISPIITQQWFILLMGHEGSFKSPGTARWGRGWRLLTPDLDGKYCCILKKCGIHFKGFRFPCTTSFFCPTVCIGRETRCIHIYSFIVNTCTELETKHSYWILYHRNALCKLVATYVCLSVHHCLRQLRSNHRWMKDPLS